MGLNMSYSLVHIVRSFKKLFLNLVTKYMIQPDGMEYISANVLLIYLEGRQAVGMTFHPILYLIYCVEQNSY